MNHEILIYNETSKKIPRKVIKETILLVLNFLNLKQPVELAVLVVSAKEIKKLNKTWRHKNYTPDELSFGLNSRQNGKSACWQARLAKGRNKVLELGEVIINVNKIVDKNKFSGILVHSLLHLLEYNHEKSKIESRKMEKVEKQILKYLNTKY